MEVSYNHYCLHVQCIPELCFLYRIMIHVNRDQIWIDNKYGPHTTTYFSHPWYAFHNAISSVCIWIDPCPIFRYHFTPADPPPPLWRCTCTVPVSTVHKGDRWPVLKTVTLIWCLRMSAIKRYPLISRYSSLSLPSLCADRNSTEDPKVGILVIFCHGWL